MHWHGMRNCFTALLMIFVPLGALAEQQHRAPYLSAVGAFYSGAAPRKMAQVQKLGLNDLRDGLRWPDIEPNIGVNRFDKGSGAHLSALQSRGLIGPIMLLPQSPLRHGGKTVISDNDLRAFARYVKATADHFPKSRIEIANEFNGGAFVSGPARRGPASKRAALHARILAEIAKADVPSNRVIGGALHSMAGGYLWSLLDAGAAAHMSAIAIHPYTTAPEALPRQMAVLRRHPQMADLHVDVTEFGTRDRQRAADFFWRSYCQMTLADVRSAHWYPLGQRKDGYVPVLDHKLDLTPVGTAITFAADALAGQPVVPVRPDPFTYGCLFDDRHLVIWGAERAVTLNRADLKVLHGDPHSLSQDRVMVIRASSDSPAIDLDQDIAFGPQTVLFDSFDQFEYPDTSEPDLHPRYLTHNGIARAFTLCPGQDRPEAPWYPHLCLSDLPRAVLHDRGFVLPHRPVTVHTSHLMTQDARLMAQVDMDVHSLSTDGVDVALHIDGERHAYRRVQGKQSFVFGPLTVARGALVELVLGAGATTKGDQGKFRFRLSTAP